MSFFLPYTHTHMYEIAHNVIVTHISVQNIHGAVDQCRFDVDQCYRDALIFPRSSTKFLKKEEDLF